MISVASGFQYSVNIGYDLNNEEKILQILETMQNQIGTMQNQMNSMQESMDRQFSELREQMKADHLAVGEMFEKAYEKIGEVSDKVERIDKKLEANIAVTKDNTYDIALLRAERGQKQG